jgi:hypothetical protein
MANRLTGDILNYLSAAHIFEWFIFFGIMVLVGAILENIINRKMVKPELDRRKRIGDRRKACRESFKHSFWKVPDRRR